jgi:type I pantothenate kinase
MDHVKLGIHAPGTVTAIDEDAYLTFTRDQWASLRAATPMTLTDDDVEQLRGSNVALTRDEVEQVYLPLARLLDLHVQATRQQSLVTEAFLGRPSTRVPYVLGIAGSVAVGKSTAARVLAELLGRWPHRPRVALVTTDGFLYPNAELERRGLLDRKGFPDSYDRRRLLAFVERLRAGADEVAAPVYSHVTYDIVPDAEQLVVRPDVVVIEGLNVLQGNVGGPALSDRFDFSIFIDAPVEEIARWYVERFHTFRRTAFRDPGSYFRHYAELTDEQAEAEAGRLWRTINEVNLREHILPTRQRARLVLHKGPDHAVAQVRLRRR